MAILVVTSFSSVCDLATTCTATTNPDVGTSLCDKQTAAQDTAVRGDTRAEANILRAFDHQVSAQTGKALTTGKADMLTTLVYYLKPAS